jgi:hypothetical protein
MGAAGGAGLSAAAIQAGLGEVIAGLQPCRETAERVTVFGSVEVALQDIAAGWLAYSAARMMQLRRILRRRGVPVPMRTGGCRSTVAARDLKNGLHDRNERPAVGLDE